MDDTTPPHGFPRPVYTNGSQPGPAPQARDDTTRYLSAAAHLDPEYANDAIREFLVEDTRQVPPSAGLDVAAVLGEAVAARTRRKLRDIALTLLLFGFLFVASPELVAMWIVLAIAASVPLMRRALKKLGISTSVAWYVAGGALLLVVFVTVLPDLVDELFDSGSSGSGYSSGYPTYAVEPAASAGALIGGILILAAMLAVLLADRFVVWKHLKDRFWRNRLSTSAPDVSERTVFQYSPARFLTQLRRYAQPRSTIAAVRPDEPPQRTPGGPVQLIVYRDFVPFIGSGLPEEPWSIAVPLERAPETVPESELTTESLYEGIRTEIESLREMSTMMPGRRLGELTVTERVIVSADELIDHMADPTAADFLRGPGHAPYTLVRRDRAQAIKTDPLEWARYYQCYQVETWDRDLVVSVFVHVAVGRDVLYVEWTPCILRPIRKKYQAIDEMRRSPLRPFGQALLDLVRLPASLPGRLKHTFTFLRPLPQDGGISPAMYGVSSTLRELASDPEVHNYFQLSDIDRYLKTMESRSILAVSRMMRAAGYSAASFDQQAATVVNNNVNIGGSVDGNVVAGTGNKVGATPARSA